MRVLETNEITVVGGGDDAVKLLPFVALGLFDVAIWSYNLFKIDQIRRHN